MLPRAVNINTFSPLLYLQGADLPCWVKLSQSEISESRCLESVAKCKIPPGISYYSRALELYDTRSRDRFKVAHLKPTTCFKDSEDIVHNMRPIGRTDLRRYPYV